MQGNKENQEISVVGRLFSLEALVFLMGIVSLVYGLVTLNLSTFMIGALIVVVIAILSRFLRRMQPKSNVKGERNE